LGFLASVVCFRFSHKSLMLGTSRLAEGTIHSMRVRFLELIQRANLRDVERLHYEDIYVSVNSEMEIVAESAFTLTTIIETALILAVIMTYLALISPIGLVCVIIFVLVAAAIHLRHNNRINREHQAIFDLESVMMRGFTDLLEGFKEIKMNNL